MSLPALKPNFLSMDESVCLLSCGILLMLVSAPPAAATIAAPDLANDYAWFF